MQRFMRWMYKGNRPNGLARALNRLSAWIYKSNRAPQFASVLEVRGRRSGQPVTMPVVVIHLNGARYLVSMLGQNVNWVKNVRAAGGSAVVIKGDHERVHLVELPPADRAPIIKRYLEVATSGRQHFPVGPDASLAEIAAIAPAYPVFRIDPVGQERR